MANDSFRSADSDSGEISQIHRAISLEENELSFLSPTHNAPQKEAESESLWPPQPAKFIDRSWRFMSAYRHGLTGKAADWAVRQQRAHRTITENGMQALEAVVAKK